MRAGNPRESRIFPFAPLSANEVVIDAVKQFAYLLDAAVVFDDPDCEGVKHSNADL